MCSVMYSCSPSALHRCCLTYCIHAGKLHVLGYKFVTDFMFPRYIVLCGSLANAFMVVVAGMKFFPGYVNDARRQLLDAAAFRWHQTGQQQKQLMKWRDRSQLQGGMLMLEAPTPPAVAQKGKQGRPRQDLLPSSAPVAGSSTQSSGVAALVSGLCTSGKTVPVPLAVY